MRLFRMILMKRILKKKKLTSSDVVFLFCFSLNLYRCCVVFPTPPTFFHELHTSIFFFHRHFSTLENIFHMGFSMVKVGG